MARRKEAGADVNHEEPAATGEADVSFNPTEIEAQPEKKPFNPIRSWSQRYVQPVAYQQLTDANLFVPGASQRGAIVFKFPLPRGQYKPDPEVLEVMQSHKTGYQDQPTGLRFMQSREHGPAWVIPNDMEGRILAEKIEQALGEVAKKLEAEERSR